MGVAMDTPQYSIVIPIFNESQSLPELVRRLEDVLGRLDGPAEVIFVDDGSGDDGPEFVRRVHLRDRRFKLIRFSRNFGHQLAITAGLDAARGAAVAVMDADLQDPPEVLLEMVEKWRQGFAVVYGRRSAREGESWFKRATAAAFYRLLELFVDFKVPVDAGDFRLVDRRALAAFRRLRERNRFVRGMFSWIGFPQTEVVYCRHKRYAGSTKYPLRKMARLAANAIVGFSDKPLRLALGIGFGFAAAALLYGLAAIVIRLGGFYVVPGWASLAAIICFIGGVQLIVLGIIGEYIGRIYEETKGRPLYIIGETVGFETDAS